MPRAMIVFALAAIVLLSGLAYAGYGAYEDAQATSYWTGMCVAGDDTACSFAGGSYAGESR